MSAGNLNHWEKESELALKAVSNVEDMTLEVLDKGSVVAKESLRDIVTSTDKAIEKKIRAMLEASGHSIVGEETFDSSQKFEPSSTSPIWLIDPIDGTANFVAGMPFFGISVGLFAKGRFAVGAVALPCFKELYFTHGNRGAFLNGRRLQVADTSLSQSLIAVSFSGGNSGGELRKRQYELFGTVNDVSRGCLRLGSAATNICYVGSGRLQAAYGLDAQIWDVAGALAIAQNAGATVYFNRKPHSTRMDYVVGAPTVVAELKIILERAELVRFSNEVSL